MLMLKLVISILVFSVALGIILGITGDLIILFIKKIKNVDKFDKRSK